MSDTTTFFLIIALLTGIWLLAEAVEVWCNKHESD